MVWLWYNYTIDGKEHLDHFICTEIIEPKDWMLVEKEFYKLGLFVLLYKYLENHIF